MRVTVERAAVLKALAHVQSVVERRNTIPILSNVLIEAEDDGLRLMATDLDLQIIETVPATTVQRGATTVAAHTIFDIVRKLPDGSQIELTLADGRLSVAAGRSRFQLATLPRDDFPIFAEGDLPHSFTIPAATLRQTIDRTRFAISTEETRYYLNGIFMHVTDEAKPALRAVATDGHRLARVAIERPEGADGMPDVIVPRKAVAEVRKLLDEMDGDVQVSLSESKIRFAFENAVLTSKLIDGTFPDYERVIPTGNDKIMSVDCRSFAAAVDRVSTISTEKSRAVKMTVQGDTLVLSANSPEAGSASEEMPVQYEGPALEIGFNSRYLLDIALQIEGEEAEFAMIDASSPTVVRDLADSSALYVLMPMRV